MTCQQYYDSLPNCYCINISYERDPKVDPCNLDNADSPSTTIIKCDAWGSQASLDASLATNSGQYRGPASNITDQPFHVVIAASNGYTKNSPPPPLTGFTGPISTGGAINAPFLPNETNTYLGAKIFPGASFDPAICAATCTTQTTYNLAHPRSDGSSSSCVFFNVFLLSLDDVPQGAYCSLYTVPWVRGYGTNFGQYRSGSDGVSRRYEVSQSYAYTVGV